MEEERPVYRDLWKEYLMVMEKAKKPMKLFNKVKWEEVITHLRVISHDMIDLDQHEQVAQVYQSIAEVYGILERPLDQRKHLLMAARTYYKLLKTRFEMRYTTQSDLADLMEEQFLKAVDLSLKQNMVSLTGVIFAEMANCFASVRMYNQAHRYFVKGARILQTDFFDQCAILKQIMQNACHCKDMNEPLSDVFLLWQPFCRKFVRKETEDLSAPDAPEEPLRETLRTVELDFVLVSLRRLLNQDELGKSILTDYDGNYRASLKTSVLTKLEFEKVSAFVAAARERNHFEVGALSVSFLFPLLDDFGKQLMSELQNDLNDHPPPRVELREIAGDQSLSSREKLKKMMEFHALNYREKRKRAEFID